MVASDVSSLHAVHVSAYTYLSSGSAGSGQVYEDLGIA